MRENFRGRDNFRSRFNPRSSPNGSRSFVVPLRIESGTVQTAQDRLPELLRDEPQHPGGGDAEGDIADKFVHESGLTVARQETECPPKRLLKY